MRSALRLMPLFLRRDGARNEIASAGLTAVGVAVATALALTVLSFLPGLSGRADRMAWREPTPVALDRATAVQERSVDLFDGQVIDRIDLAPYAAVPDSSGPADFTASGGPAHGAPRRAAVGAPSSSALRRAAVGGSADGALGSRPAMGRLAVDLPVPPGLDDFPEPGEIYTSPAMARLLQDTPADELADRFPGRIAGTIGSAGLAHEDELVIVVGRAAGDLVPQYGESRLGNPDERLPSEPSPVRAISSFASSGDDSLLTTYWQAIAVIAVLLTVPAVLLVGSAARLTAARRNQRLAALRLAGATPSGVVALTAAETALAALVGAVAGLGLYALLLPLAAQFELAGGPWAVSDLWLGVGPALATLVVVPVIAALSATIALRLVSVSPLGVAQGVSTRRPRLVRFLAVGVAWCVLAAAATSVRDGGGIAVLLIGVGAVMASLGLVGPWIAWALGKVIAGLSRRPSTLLAGRRIVDDPKGAYRAVSGIVLAGFIAGLLFAISPTIEQRDDVDGRPSHAMSVFLGGGTIDPAVVPAAQARLAADGLDATVELDELGDLWVEPGDPPTWSGCAPPSTGSCPTTRWWATTSSSSAARTSSATTAGRPSSCCWRRW